MMKKVVYLSSIIQKKIARSKGFGKIRPLGLQFIVSPKHNSKENSKAVYGW